MKYYGLFGKFIAIDGEKDRLLEILQKAADILKTNKDCLHYMISTSASPDEIYVYETWISKESHDRSLDPPEVKALIQRAMPLISSMDKIVELDVDGGKGI